ncbi:MAG: hypothetical protein LC772_08280, partial [Chloroflexi bacterium]|nr:hypothetical protein [Chloroflexota bacterium]
GLVLVGMDPPFLPETIAMAAICIAGATVVDQIRRDEVETALRHRGYVVLERMAPECIALPPPARDRMLDAVAALARQLGYRERQLGLVFHCSEQGVRLRVMIQALDRDSGLEVTRAEVEGDRDDVSGLIGDLSTRLLAQIPRPAALNTRPDDLPPGRPFPIIPPASHAALTSDSRASAGRTTDTRAEPPSSRNNDA